MTKRSALLRQQGDMRPFIIEDSSGYGNHGVIPNNPALNPGNTLGIVPGPYAGGARNFGTLVGTSGGGVAITSPGAGGGSPILDIGSAPLTVAGWFNLTSGTISTQFNALYTRSSGGNNGVLVGTRSTAPGTTRTMAAINSGIFFDPLFGATVSTGTWVHLAWVGDPVGIHQWLAYVNGVQLGNGSCGGMGLPGVAYAYICGGFGGAAATVAGLGFYPSALSVGQLTAHVAAGTSYAAYKAAALANSPVGLWMLDELQY